ncbi:MAG: hypothetical protein HY900_16720 [Deltaproteobacteria bacterium]|nr:hypothetical protein [Deltaproteobacteria bacterium]
MRFAKRDYAGASEAFARAKLTPEDVYLLGVAEKRIGRLNRARELFESLSRAGDATLASLAQFQLQAVTAGTIAQGSR